MKNKFLGMQRKLAVVKYKNPTSKLNSIVIAGEYGKTTTARLLEGIFKESGRKVCVIATTKHVTFDGFYGALSRAKKEGYTTVIITASTELLELGALEGVVPECAVFTTSIAQSQALLKLSPKHVVSPSGMDIPEGTVEPYQHISVGDDDMAEAKRESITLYKKGTEIQMTIDHQTKLNVATPLVGKANAYNVATAIAAAYVFGIDAADAQEGIAELEPTPGNFEYISSSKPYEVIVDRGVSSDSLRLSLESAKVFAKRRLLVALDTMPSEKDMAFVRDNSDRVFVVTDDTSPFVSGVDTVNDIETAFEKVTRAAKQDDLILFCGDKYAHVESETSFVKHHLNQAL